MKGKIVAIRADIPNLSKVMAQVERMGHDLPYTQEAVKTATEVVQRTWLEAISGVTVSYSGGTFRVRVVSGEYLRSVADGLSYPALGDKFTGEVIALAPHAHIVEDGIKPFDMKQTHLKGARVKISKTGSRYVTVPFRHQVPGATSIGDPMPGAVYQKAKMLAVSRRNGLIKKWITGKPTTWGDRLESASGGEREKPNWSTGRYTGMVKMAGKPHSSYITFRRISDNSHPDAWKHPGVPARPVTEAVTENVRDDVIDLIRTGFEVDLATLGF